MPLLKLARMALRRVQASAKAQQSPSVQSSNPVQKKLFKLLDPNLLEMYLDLQQIVLS